MGRRLRPDQAARLSCRRPSLIHRRVPGVDTSHALPVRPSVLAWAFVVNRDA